MFISCGTVGSVEIHHAGFFVGQGASRAYVDGKVNWFDHSRLTLGLLYGYRIFYSNYTPNNRVMKNCWLLSGKDLGGGLRIITDDSNTLVMTSLVHKMKNFVIYIDHDDNLFGLNWDDIVANPITSLPKVLRPHKVAHVDNNKMRSAQSFMLI
jgi:hypothetical protein